MKNQEKRAIANKLAGAVSSILPNAGAMVNLGLMPALLELSTFAPPDLSRVHRGIPPGIPHGSSKMSPAKDRRAAKRRAARKRARRLGHG